ncbi:MAG: diaminohydroxyphosphoribosylaminopyrimidine deaminase [Myxococcota bacterium]|jgi:diaminohydroxyphosphoribosylaminopyrimidine deaminase/5-amino-6-(5-phosphoribosylamino)uracil reductase
MSTTDWPGLLRAADWLAVHHDRPLIVLKAGVTADGRIASAFGESQWITGPAARTAGHQLRHRLDAVLVGSGTLLADDPSLSTRLPDGAGRDARPVLLDTMLRCPEGAKVLTAGQQALIFCAQDAPSRSLPAEIVRVPRAKSGEGLSVSAVLSALVARGLHSVLVEGGGRVHRSLIEAGVVDRIELFIAPKVFAGGPGWVGGAPLHLQDAPVWRIVSATVLGGDVQLSMEPRSPVWSNMIQLPGPM